MHNIPYDRDALIAWYARHSETYDGEFYRQDETVYGADVYRSRLVGAVIDHLRPRRILDVGCGTAEPMLALLKAGHDVRGFDLSPGMVEQAGWKLEQHGFDPGLVGGGDVLDWASIQSHGETAFDAVIANGVHPYIKDSETAHANMIRLIRPGGYYIAAYSNELFDLTTFNRFTVRFHEQNFIAPLELDADLREEAATAIGALLTHSDKPSSIPNGARDDIFVRSHNPLTLGTDLARHGVTQEDIMFYKFHAFPPLLKEASPRLATAFLEHSRRQEISRARDWQGYFTASAFIIVGRKAG